MLSLDRDRIIGRFVHLVDDAYDWTHIRKNNLFFQLPLHEGKKVKTVYKRHMRHAEEVLD